MRSAEDAPVWHIETEWQTSFSSLVVLAVRDASGILAGQAVLYDEADMVYLYSLSVASSYWGRGAGAALVEAVEARCMLACRYGLLKDEISVASPASGMYRRRGWKTTSQPHWLQYIPKAGPLAPLSMPLSQRIIGLHAR